MAPKTLKLFAVLSLSLAFAGPAVSTGLAQPSAALTVIVRGLRNDQGQVLGALYDGAGTWLDHDHVADRCRATISHGVARCTFRHAAPGAVAVAAMHDENLDGELGRDLVGIPQEGYAFSNDVRPSLGPPSFESATLPPATRSTTVHAHYGI